MVPESIIKQMSESFVSNVSEGCCKCERLEKENSELREKLADCRRSLQVFEQVERQLLNLQAATAHLDIDNDNLVQGFTYAFEKLYVVDSKELVSNAAQILSLITSLRSPHIKQQPPAQPRSQKQKSPPHRTQAVPNLIHPITQSQQLPPTQTIPTQKKPPLLESLNRYESEVVREGEGGCSWGKGGCSWVRNWDEEVQMKSRKGPAEDISLPLIWQKRTFFQMKGNTIRKMYNDIYKKIRTEAPLPQSGMHTVKIEMVRNGTFAFGVVTGAFKDEHMIDDRKCDALKYLSFENGGGLVKLCGEELMGGPRVHLSQGQVLHLHFDADALQLTFKNPNLQKPLQVALPPRFKNKHLYFFLEMKQADTTIRMI